jgi:hypothetical protein
MPMSMRNAGARGRVVAKKGGASLPAQQKACSEHRYVTARLGVQGAREFVEAVGNCVDERAMRALRSENPCAS